VRLEAVSGLLLRTARGVRALPLAGCALLFLGPIQASAQTVRPVIAEYRQKASAKFDVVNNSVVPLNVVLEPKSFSLSEDGMPIFRPLDKDIHLKLSSMSFRIPPQQTRYVFYEATADHYPAWFVIYATFANLPKQSGLNVELELPHTVYLLQKEPLEKSSIGVAAAEFEPGSSRVRVEVENHGERLGRVLEVEVTHARIKSVHAGFPLLPHSRRRLEIDWKSPTPPDRLLIRFQKFNIEQALQSRRN
jgi:hypothetical protein